MEHQNWDTFYIHANNQNKPKNEETKKPAISKETKMDQKIEEGNLKHNKTPAELGKLIQSRRLSQNMTQKDLAQKLNIPVKMINEIESGKAKHNPQVISKIKRILNISNK